MAENDSRSTLRSELFHEWAGSSSHYGGAVSLRLERSRQIAQMDLHAPDRVCPSNDVDDLQLSSPLVDSQRRFDPFVTTKAPRFSPPRP
jgi:hypothetical protein